MCFSNFYIRRHIVCEVISFKSFVLLLEIIRVAILHLENFNVVPVLFFAADFNMFSSRVFISLTLAFHNLASFIRLLCFLEKILISFFCFSLKSLKQTRVIISNFIVPIF